MPMAADVCRRRKWIVIQQFDLVRIFLNRWIVQSSDYIQTRDVNTVFLTKPVIVLWKPVIYR